eukprot:COSAG04_NODE_8940_length_915_cov_1.063725_2_plen_138_part_00
MKELAVDESLSEEARDSARKALDALVSSQLLEIEQSAALKKLESEAQFANQQAQIEHDAALAKLQAEANFAQENEQQSVADLLGTAHSALREDLEELGVEVVEDFQELEAADIEQLAAKLKKVQSKKFAKKMAALQA